MNTLSESVRHSSWYINAAMRDIYDIGEKIQFFPILLLETARQVYDYNNDFYKSLDVPKIDWGIFEKNVTPEVKSLFKTWNFKENEKGYEYSFENIPIQIHIIRKKWPVLENLDMRFYKIDEFRIPNPFEKYWRQRNLVK